MLLLLLLQLLLLLLDLQVSLILDLEERNRFSQNRKESRQFQRFLEENYYLGPNFLIDSIKNLVVALQISVIDIHLLLYSLTLSVHGVQSDREFLSLRARQDEELRKRIEQVLEELRQLEILLLELLVEVLDKEVGDVGPV